MEGNLWILKNKSFGNFVTLFKVWSYHIEKVAAEALLLSNHQWLIATHLLSYVTKFRKYIKLIPAVYILGQTVRIFFYGGRDFYIFASLLWSSWFDF